MYTHTDLELQLLHMLLNPVFIIWRDACLLFLLVNMDKMSFSLDYFCYCPRFLEREACAYSVDLDQMSHNSLCNQGLHGLYCSTLSQQCLDSGYYNDHVKNIEQVW